MTTTQADEIVLTHLLAQASGVRMRARDALVGVRAGLLEEELSKRLLKTQELLRSQNRTDDGEELPLALAASAQPGGKR